MIIPQSEIDFLNLLISKFWSGSDHLQNIKYVELEDGRVDIQFACSATNYYKPEVPLYMQVLYMYYCMTSECDEDITDELFLNIYCRDRCIYLVQIAHPEQPLVRYEQELLKTDSEEEVIAKIESLLYFYHQQSVGDIPLWQFTTLPLQGKRHFSVNVKNRESIH